MYCVVSYNESYKDSIDSQVSHWRRTTWIAENNFERYICLVLHFFGYVIKSTNTLAEVETASLSLPLLFATGCWCHNRQRQTCAYAGTTVRISCSKMLVRCLFSHFVLVRFPSGEKRNVEASMRRLCILSYVGRCVCDIERKKVDSHARIRGEYNESPQTETNPHKTIKSPWQQIFKISFSVQNVSAECHSSVYLYRVCQCSHTISLWNFYLISFRPEIFHFFFSFDLPLYVFNVIIFFGVPVSVCVWHFQHHILQHLPRQTHAHMCQMALSGLNILQMLYLVTSCSYWQSETGKPTFTPMAVPEFETNAWDWEQITMRNIDWAFRGK